MLKNNCQLSLKKLSAVLWVVVKNIFMIKWYGIKIKGLKINNARRNGESSPIVDEKSSAVTEGGKVVTAYLLAGPTLIKTKVRLLALDKTDKELGRASVNLELAAGDAKYVDFKFDSRTPLNEVSTVVLEAD